MFYWDYDLFYTRLPHEQSIPFAHEAGEFILRNLKTYPNELPESAFDAMRRPKRITFIGAPTENAQARYLPHWFESVKRDERERGAEASTEKENAVVLCNEAMLLPVLHAIPPGGGQRQRHDGLPPVADTRVQFHKRRHRAAHRRPTGPTRDAMPTRP